MVSFLKQLDIAPLLQDETPIGKLVLPQGLGPLLPIHQNYLKRRNYDPEELEKLWGIRGIGLARKLSWRIWIPVTFRGKTVSWLTRAISDEGTRYVAASPQEEALPHKQLLFGEDRTRHAIVVTEGPFDVMRIGPGAVCTFGVSYSEQQLLKIAHHPIRYVAYDQEEKAQLKAKGLCEKLSLWPGKTTNIILDSKDPGESTKREILLLRRLLR